MRIKACPTVWLDGKFVPKQEALIPVTTHALHYGTSAFEGIRGYWNGSNLNVFRLPEHVRRLRNSGLFYNITLKYTDREVQDAIVSLCSINNIRESCYIRPLYFVAEWGISLHVEPEAPTRFAIIVFPMQKYFDDSGVRVCMSSRRRISDQALYSQAKMGGNYLNSVAATIEAKGGGYDDAIMLDQAGNVSEAPGANVFLVQNGTLVTPDLASSALNGITKDTVIRLARENGIDTVHRQVALSELYTADEIFMTGTAAEVTPVIQIGHHSIKPGPITRKLAKVYTETVHGQRPSPWLTPVY